MNTTNRIRSLVRRELSLGRRSTFARLAACATFVWAVSGPAALAQAPFRQEVLPGLSSFDAGNFAAPALVDLDADGDFDLVAGQDAGLLFFENVRAPVSPGFRLATGAENPFSAIAIAQSIPELVDLDADGDLDAVLGELNGSLHYFENTLSSTNPAFVERTGSANPFAGIDVGDRSHPELADLDGDGDLDLVVGERLGQLFFFANTGGPAAPAFVAVTGSASPFQGIDVGQRSAPLLGDLDADGDLDLAVGEIEFGVLYFANTGTSAAPTFVARTGTANPFGVVDVPADHYTSRPELADLDADGDLDAIVGEAGGALLLFENTGTSAAPAFAADTGGLSSNAEFTIVHCEPDLADLDGDGDLDAVIGDYQAALRYFTNTGGATRPAFSESTGSANPFAAFGPDTGTYPNPELADIDGDGDLDAVIGVFVGELLLLRNTGSTAAPSFVLETGSANPFAAIFFPGDLRPALADLDADGDLDLLVSTPAEAEPHYFKNTGSPSSPAFLDQTGAANPFAGFAVDGSPVLADADGDGDFDLAVGGFFGDVVYFANTGTAAAPAFVEVGAGNPFAGIDPGFSISPEIADLELDGDVDALVCESEGWMVFYASQAANVFADGFESGDLGAWHSAVGAGP